MTGDNVELRKKVVIVSEKIALQGVVRFTQVVYRYDIGHEAIPEYNVPEDKGTPKAFVNAQIGVGFFFSRNTDGIIEQ